MAVVKVYRTWEDSGDTTGETHSYKVEFDTIAATAREARFANDGVTAIPLQGSTLSGTIWTADVSATRDTEEPSIWDVQVRWQKPDFGGKENKESKPSPSTQKWNIKIECSEMAYERPYDKDKDGNQIKNSAGTPYSDPPAVFTEYDLQWTFNFTTKDGTILTKIKDCLGRRNLDVISWTYKGVNFSIPAKYGRLTAFTFGIDHSYTGDDYAPPVVTSSSSSSVAPDLEEVFSVSLTIEQRLDGEQRDLELQNSGYRDINGLPFVDADNNPVSTPVFLTTGGLRLTSGVANPLYFEIKAPVNYATLFTGL